jgi:hypothetical protein
VSRTACRSETRSAAVALAASVVAAEPWE